jgi:ribosomal protein L44E
MPEEIKGYCVKCKAERVIKDVQTSEAAGRTVVKGKCSVCGSEITRFVEKR